MSGKEKNVDNIQLSEFFRNVAKGIKKFGIKSIIYHLQNLNLEEKFKSENIEKIVDFIIDCVIEEWKIHKITKNDLFESNKRGEAAIARKMAIILIRNHTKASDIEVARYFGKVRQVSFRAMKDFKNLKRHIPDDAKFLEKYERLDAKVKNFINELNNQKNGSSN
jgi:chromosomal replication initiation ATPase DnaA